MEGLAGIVSRAKELFITCGVKSITMDDLAHEMGISKKTLYVHIPTKAKLLERVIQAHIKEEKKAILEIQVSATNAIEEMILISQYVLQILRKVSPRVIFEMKKYYREGWDKMERLHNEHIHSVIRENIHNGIHQGYYRKDLNIDIIAQHYITISNSIVDESIFPMMTMERIFLETIKYHLRGICTPSGWELYQKQISKHSNS